ncbi:restriction endonuclease subunit S [Pantoea agglomerans]|uniref:restriction endonuclease subunit S n=1 Tax=Enterobacter agglomerans TaxID=549 RepID=UPI003C79B5A6
MIFKPLASIAKIVAGQSPESSTYNSTGEGLPFFQGKADFQDMHPTVRMWCTSEKRKEAESGDILISVRAPVGAVNICNQKSIIGRGLAAIRPLSELDGKFLYYWLKANEKKIDALGTGSTFKAITQDTLKKIEVPIPPLDDQIRIAHLLGKVEELIVLRRQHLRQLDNLLKSVFLEIFGDPVRNEMGWDKPELKKFGKISTGNTPPRNDPANYDGDFIEWIKTDNITRDAVFVTSATEYLSEVGARKARTVTSGALLVACIAGSTESIGRAALTNRKVSFNQQINAIQPGKDVNPLYLYALFKLSQAYIQSHAAKGMKKILTKSDFEKITMIKPPVETQNEFAAIAEKIEVLKSHYQQSLADLESLYGVLSQQAFKGNLDLSRVCMPDSPAQYAASVSQGDKSAVPELVLQTLPAIQLPETDDSLAALENAEARKTFITEWLEAYRAQLAETPFSLQQFMELAQNRLAELHPDNDLVMGASDYEYIKTWMFEALAAGTLTQVFDDAGNCIKLQASIEQSPA